MPAWRIEHDALVIGALHLAMQRTGRAGVQAGARPRSWGVAPLHAAADGVLVPCGPTEVLWLGAWVEGAGATATVSIADGHAGAAARIQLPPQDRIVTLHDAGGGTHVMALDAGGPAALQLDLSVQQGAADVRLALLVLPSATWGTRTGRVPPPPLAHPPPLPPRLG